MHIRWVIYKEPIYSHAGMFWVNSNMNNTSQERKSNKEPSAFCFFQLRCGCLFKEDNDGQLNPSELLGEKKAQERMLSICAWDLNALIW